MQLPKTGCINVKTGKPVAINQIIDRRSVVAISNSDGEYQMIERAGAAAGA
jgi:hypothetical protein